MTHSIEVEIERNYATFLSLLNELLPKEAGRYMLLQGQKLRGVFDSASQAERAGFEKYGDEPYSIQEISDEPVDLGFYSYAIPEGHG
ncbi:hypothetical protein IM511_08275 [Erythrobacteraceae bacterium E2-1 Yellow Sea]|nr:hypothetical protein [Erythrobacteraceae bacterium E2-1 Yellow Sea]